MKKPQRVITYTPVPRLWPGETVVCIASGPSLTDADVSYVRGKARVIVVNRTYEKAPWADALYACDAKFWDWYKGVPEFAGLKYALVPAAARWPRVQVLENTGHGGLELRPTGLRTGRNSGYQAINLAVHLGAARILLLGFDMKRGPKGEEHWHPHHPGGPSNSPFQAFLSAFQTILTPLRERGIEVVNCSRSTALKCFPWMPIEQALPEERLEVAS